MFVESTRASPIRSSVRESPARALNPLAAAILLALASLPTAQAATIIVTTAGDAGVANTCTLRQAVLSMNNSTLSGNCANSGGAFGTNNTINFAPAINTVTLADAPNNTVSIGESSLKIDAGAGRVVVVERPAAALNPFSVITSASGNLQLIGLTIQNGRANNDFANKYSKYESFSTGGGVVGYVSNVTLDRCIVRNNSADVGGGVFVLGQLTIKNSLVQGNTALFGGGAATMTKMKVIDSTLSQNSATEVYVGNDRWVGGYGGAIGSIFGSVELVNSTVSGNLAATSGAAIGLKRPFSPLSVLNSTLACNDSTAAIHTEFGGQASPSVTGTILANTSNSRCTTGTLTEIAVADTQLTISGSNNLVDDPSAIDPSATFATTPTFGDPQLGPLQNNGGPTSTHALLIGSPAINQGSNPANLAFDQRGADHSRTTGRSTDIGAYEYPYAGLCGSAHGRSFTTLNDGSPNLCAAGAVLQGSVAGSGPWAWFCADAGDPGTNEFCGARVLPTVGLAVTNPGGTPIGSAVFGQPVRLKSTVSGSASLPAGTVSFFDMTGSVAPICVDVPLINSGGVMSATCNVPPNAIVVGTRALKSSYGGNGIYGPASDAGSSLTVQPATTTTTITSQTPNPVWTGLPYTVVAQIMVNAPSLATPSGIVTVDDQTDNLSCSYFVGAETPGCAITPLTAGAHTLQVSFGDDPNMTSSSATTTHAVQNRPDDIFENGFDS